MLRLRLKEEERREVRAFDVHMPINQLSIISPSFEQCVTANTSHGKPSYE
jgi:hypothetical protein